MPETTPASVPTMPSDARGQLPVIHARGVGKRFGEMDALKELDLYVFQGECVGLLGPNGAGKSTFIGCLYGTVLRTAGELRVFGHDPALKARQIKQRLGVVPQENALDEELTVRENMQLYARFGGISATDSRKPSCSRTCRWITRRTRRSRRSRAE